jgi:mannose-6-phosphate isomerase-like protein (cupin superfamily)
MVRLFIAACAAALAATSVPVAAQQSAAPAAIYVPKADLTEVLKKATAGDKPGSDTTAKSVPGKQNTVSVNIGHRTKAGASNAGGTHADLTEIYYIIEGSGTVLTGGTLSAGGPGGAIQNGTSQRVTVGDVVVIPPNTPHTFSAVESDRVVFLNIRIGPGQ